MSLRSCIKTTAYTLINTCSLVPFGSGDGMLRSRSTFEFHVRVLAMKRKLARRVEIIMSRTALTADATHLIAYYYLKDLLDAMRPEPVSLAMRVTSYSHDVINRAHNDLITLALENYLSRARVSLPTYYQGFTLWPTHLLN